jgi:hypothetical protein
MSGGMISYGLYKAIKNADYPIGKKIAIATGYVIGGLATAFVISVSLTYGIRQIWGPPISSVANLPAVSSTVEIPVVSGYKNYQNQTMTINWLRYPQNWVLDEDADRLGFTFFAPDNHVAIGGVLYAETSSIELPALFSEISQGAQHDGIVIIDEQIEDINGHHWLEYDYKTQVSGQTHDNRAAIYVLPLNDNRQFIKLQLLETKETYFATDIATLDTMLSSINFAH